MYNYFLEPPKERKIGLHPHRFTSLPRIRGQIKDDKHMHMLKG